MPNKQLLVDINDVGEKTCASRPGKFCVYFGSRKFGQDPICMLFPNFSYSGQTEHYTHLEEKDGWVQRCKACIDAEKNMYR